MWQDYYLKFGDEAAFAAAMAGLQTYGFDGVVDEVGVIVHEDTGAVTEGYHVNVRLAAGSPLPVVLARAEIGVPVAPKRVFMEDVVG